MRDMRFVAVTAAVVLLTSGAVRAEEKAAAAPRPASEMAQMKVFESKWSCTGSVNASPSGPAHRTVATVYGHRDLGDFWVSGRYHESKTPESPVPLEGMFHMTWDPGAKRFVMLWLDNTGGWAQETSPGWVGDTIVLTGEGWFGGQKLGERDTFTRKGTAELAHTYDLNMNGQWTQFGQETCTPAATATGAAKH